MRPPRVSRAWKRVSKKSLCRTMMPSLVVADAPYTARMYVRGCVVLKYMLWSNPPRAIGLVFARRRF